MRSIYAHASEPVKKDQGVTTYSPPILLVGTHKDSLDLDPKLCDKIVSLTHALSLFHKSSKFKAIAYNKRNWLKG